jgi:hypothetical protein
MNGSKLEWYQGTAWLTWAHGCVSDFRHLSVVGAWRRAQGHPSSIWPDRLIAPLHNFTDIVKEQ